MTEIKEVSKKYEIEIKSLGSAHYFTFREKEKLFQFLDMYLEHCKYGFEFSVSLEDGE